MKTLVALALALVAAVAPGERKALIVNAPDAPLRIDRASVLTPAEGPPVLLYAATNATEQPYDEFTVMAFVFAADGTLKARQVAPGRRTLDARSTKYSTLVLDGSEIGASDVIVLGVNQAQRTGSDTWWRADLQRAAEALVPKGKPK